MNSVGKSSLIQALLLIRKSYEAINKYGGKGNKEYRIAINGDYALHLGSTDQIISAKDTDFISLSLDDLTFRHSFYYLNAERLGPRNYQQMESNEFLHCGCHGEYTFDLIGKKLLDHVSVIRQFPNDDTKKVLMVLIPG